MLSNRWAAFLRSEPENRGEHQALTAPGWERSEGHACGLPGLPGSSKVAPESTRRLVRLLSSPHVTCSSHREDCSHTQSLLAPSPSGSSNGDDSCLELQPKCHFPGRRGLPLHFPQSTRVNGNGISLKPEVSACAFSAELSLHGTDDCTESRFSVQSL